MPKAVVILLHEAK